MRFMTGASLSFVTVAGLLLVASCGESTTGPTPTGSLQATITGDVVADYQGSGDFSIGHGLNFWVYHVRSEGAGASANQRFRVYHRSDPGDLVDEWYKALITEGTHPIVLLDRRDPDSRGTGVTFVETRDGIEHLYIATEGSLRITESTKERAKGTFTLTAFQYCEITLDSSERQHCPVPSSPPADASAINVSGSFTAVPDETEVEPMPGI